MVFFFKAKKDKSGPQQPADEGHKFFSTEESRAPDWDVDEDDEEDYEVEGDGYKAAAPVNAPAEPAPEKPADKWHYDRPKVAWYNPLYWQGRQKRWWAVRIIASALGLIILLTAFLLVTAPLSKSLEPIAPPQLTLLAADGTPIARNGAIVDLPVKVKDLPPHVVDAFLSIEDRRFYSHIGVDPRGLGRAIFKGVGGGSTITQQLAKFTFLTPERSLKRKAREMLIAFWLEAWLTKDEILERYLSNVYFGDNVYGLRAASMHFFYRKPEKLTVAQAAMLAGMVQAPSRFNPREHYANAKKRMQMVVKAMVANGKLTEEEAARLPFPAIDHRAKDGLPTGTYFADWALPEARKLTENSYSDEAITTTLDSRLQEAARRAIALHGGTRGQVALVAMRKNGEVVAMIGGRSYKQSSFNRAVQARRQPGSTFKLFVYLAALNAGMGPDDLIDNTEITEGRYKPKNAGGRYSESLTLEEAFAQSSNVAAVRLFDRLGDKDVINTARKMGISSPLRANDPSLALGTSGVTLLELTAAYAGVAANRYPIVPRAFPADEEGWFDWIWNGKESFSNAVHSGIERLLRAAINKGTGRAATLSIANFGKTGTSQDSRDALFVGYAGDYVVGVWVGNDDNTPLKGASGGTIPARIWKSFMEAANGKAPARKKAAQPVKDKDLAPIVPMDETPILGEDTKIEVDESALRISSDVEGVPVEVIMENGDVRFNIPPGTLTPNLPNSNQPNPTPNR